MSPTLYVIPCLISPGSRHFLDLHYLSKSPLSSLLLYTPLALYPLSSIYLYINLSYIYFSRLEPFCSLHYLRSSLSLNALLLPTLVLHTALYTVLPLLCYTSPGSIFSPRLSVLQSVLRYSSKVPSPTLHKLPIPARIHRQIICYLATSFRVPIFAHLRCLCPYRRSPYHKSKAVPRSNFAPAKNIDYPSTFNLYPFVLSVDRPS